MLIPITANCPSWATPNGLGRSLPPAGQVGRDGHPRLNPRKVYAFELACTWKTDRPSVAGSPRQSTGRAVHYRRAKMAWIVQPSDVAPPTRRASSPAGSSRYICPLDPTTRAAAVTEEGYAQEQVRRGQIGGQNLWAKIGRQPRNGRDASIRVRWAAEGVSPPDIRTGDSMRIIEPPVWRVTQSTPRPVKHRRPRMDSTAPPPFPAPELPTRRTLAGHPAGMSTPAMLSWIASEAIWTLPTGASAT